MIGDYSDNSRSTVRVHFLRVFLRIYFIILFICAVIGLSFNRQIGAILSFSLVSSLLVFICCNCGQCFKTQVISGHVLVGPPDLGIRPSITQDQQIAYIIVAPRPGPSLPVDDSQELNPQAVPPLYPVYPISHLQPPPTYDESQRQYK